MSPKHGAGRRYRITQSCCFSREREADIAHAVCPRSGVEWPDATWMLRCLLWIIRVDFGMSAACPVRGVISEMPVVRFCRLIAEGRRTFRWSAIPKTALPAAANSAHRDWRTLPGQLRPAPMAGHAGIFLSFQPRRAPAPQTAPRRCRRDGCAPILQVRTRLPLARPSTESRRPAPGPGSSPDGWLRSFIS
jgi:hypothetical protein